MQFQKHIEIASTPDAVWAHLLDLGAAPAYVPFLAKAAPVGAAQPALGTHARLTFRYAGRELTTEAVITAFDAPKHLAIHTEVSGAGLIVDVVWNLVALPKATRVTETVTLGANGLMARLAVQAMLAQVNAETELEAGLGRLKAAVEKTAGVVQPGP